VFFQNRAIANVPARSRGAARISTLASLPKRPLSAPWKHSFDANGQMSVTVNNAAPFLLKIDTKEIGFR